MIQIDLVQELKSRGYTKIQSIGYGSFGMVTLYTDQNGKQVAIKKIAEPNFEYQSLEERVSMMLSSDRHPNIIRIEKVFREPEPNGSLFIVMEYCDRGSLKDNQWKLNSNQIFSIMRGVLEGLSFMHSKRIVHRDIKPANILLTQENGNWVPKLCDFGISRPIEREQLLWTIVGTEPYMAPEYQKGFGYDLSVDVWAFGAVFYEILTGEAPFEDPSKDKMKTAAKLPHLKRIFSQIFQTMTNRDSANELLRKVFKGGLTAQEILELDKVREQNRRKIYGEPVENTSAISINSDNVQTTITQKPSLSLQPTKDKIIQPIPPLPNAVKDITIQPIPLLPNPVYIPMEPNIVPSPEQSMKDTIKKSQQKGAFDKNKESAIIENMLRKQIATAKTVNQNLTQRCNQIEQHNKSLELQNKQLEQDKKSMSKKLQNLQSKYQLNNKNDTSGEINRLQKQLHDVATQSDALQKDLVEVRRAYQDLKRQMQGQAPMALKRDNSFETNKLKEEIVILKKKIAQLQNQQQKHSESERQLRDLVLDGNRKILEIMQAWLHDCQALKKENKEWQILTLKNLEQAQQRFEAERLKTIGLNIQLQKIKADLDLTKVELANSNSLNTELANKQMKTAIAINEYQQKIRQIQLRNFKLCDQVQELKKRVQILLESKNERESPKGSKSSQIQLKNTN